MTQSTHPYFSSFSRGMMNLSHQHDSSKYRFFNGFSMVFTVVHDQINGPMSSMESAEEDQWQGLPLMSWPPSGRDTHHETRVMRDDVMCLGEPGRWGDGSWRVPGYSWGEGASE